MRRKNIEDDDAEVDMTPMLDIVFIMLIFFIVTTSFVRESGIDLNRPSPNPPEKKEDKKAKNVFIEIDAQGEVRMNGRLVDIRAIGANLETTKAEFPKAAVTIAADTDSYTEVLIEVVNAAKASGIDNVSVANPVQRR